MSSKDSGKNVRRSGRHSEMYKTKPQHAGRGEHLRMQDQTRRNDWLGEALSYVSEFDRQSWN